MISPKKRSYRESESESTYQPLNAPESPPDDDAASGSRSTLNPSAFRNVSACNRCRVRKNRCDQRLPACSGCEKAKQRCVGYDPITQREIPRHYVYYLESRVAYLESLLATNKVSFRPPEAFDPSIAPAHGGLFTPKDEKPAETDGGLQIDVPKGDRSFKKNDISDKRRQDNVDKLNNLVSNIGMVSVQGASDPRYLGSSSGISFARIAFAAVKSSLSTSTSEKGGTRSSKAAGHAAASGGNTMRDSYFGLQTKPTIKQAAFPDRALGLKLVNLYFEHSNPQIPILHRGEFMGLFNRVYSADSAHRAPRELYMLNIVFAIGAGIIWGSSDPDSSRQAEGSRSGVTSPVLKRARLGHLQQQPEEYHASAIIHLESVLGSGPGSDRSDGVGGGLEELQAVLLLCSFALLRPVAPGLWYIVGVAVRLGIDLGLHYEDGSSIDSSNGQQHKKEDLSHPVADPLRNRSISAQEKGRREWARDMRRRLWWSVYSFDRLVSTCVGRPFGVSDQVITTEFPSHLDDAFITKAGFTGDWDESNPSYKRVAYHYFRLRLLQSEILQVLQYQQAQQARQRGTNSNNRYIHTKLPSPFLVNFDSFREWRRDIYRRLTEWKDTAPLQGQTGVAFSPQFLELNYWQALIMLYRNSLAVPEPLANELTPTEDVTSPSITSIEEREDEDDIFLKVAEAGQKVLRLYRQLHRVRLVNFTYLATHHLFMAGISFLYAVWHSPAVRSRLTLDDVDFTVLAATSVLGDLMEKCPPAEACKDAFERMSKATVQMCLSTTGFGSQADQNRQRPSGPSRQSSMDSNPVEQTPHDEIPRLQAPQARRRQSRRPKYKFDMDFRELFPEDTPETVPLTSTALRNFNAANSASRNRPLSQSPEQQRSLPIQPNIGLDLHQPPITSNSILSGPLNPSFFSPGPQPQHHSSPNPMTSSPSSVHAPPPHIRHQHQPSDSSLPHITPMTDLDFMSYDLNLDLNLSGPDIPSFDDFNFNMDFAGLIAGGGHIGTGNGGNSGSGHGVTGAGYASHGTDAQGYQAPGGHPDAGGQHAQNEEINDGWGTGGGSTSANNDNGMNMSMNMGMSGVDLFDGFFFGSGGGGGGSM